MLNEKFFNQTKFLANIVIITTAKWAFVFGLFGLKPEPRRFENANRQVADLLRLIADEP